MKIKKFFIIALCLICVFTSACSNSKTENYFSNWKEGSAPITALQEYVKKVTDKNSKYYIPEQDRIVVFDLDGTLYCETFPIYGEWLMFADYVLNTPGYNASEQVKAVAEELFTIKKASAY